MTKAIDNKKPLSVLTTQVAKTKGAVLLVILMESKQDCKLQSGMTGF